MVFESSAPVGSSANKIAGLLIIAIINNPAILLADEPTGALDSKTTEDVLDLFDKLHKSGITIVLVTHEDEVANRAKKIAKFKDGKIVDLKVN